MTFYILISSVSIAMILQTFRFLPDRKPFNCPACLSSWIALIGLIVLVPGMFWTFPIAYLLTSIYLKYESI
jgi:hypothetical protein